jgi:hypothetical protein
MKFEPLGIVGPHWMHLPIMLCKANREFLALQLIYYVKHNSGWHIHVMQPRCRLARKRSRSDCDSRLDLLRSMPVAFLVILM